MNCRIGSSYPTIFYKPLAKARFFCPSLPIKPIHRTYAPTSYRNTGRQEPGAAAAATPASLQSGDTCRVNFQTLKDCKLGISRYPDFNYNAEGGKGTATGKVDDTGISQDIMVSFDVASLYIPPLMSATTRFLGLPLPPFLRIDIVPELFNGVVNREKGKVDLDFRAKFWFSVGCIYQAPPLIVETKLTSEESKGSLRDGKGERLDGEGRCRLVGVATIDPIDDLLMNTFLSLPTECLALLNARIIIS